VPFSLLAAEQLPAKVTSHNDIPFCVHFLYCDSQEREIVCLHFATDQIASSYRKPVTEMRSKEAIKELTIFITRNPVPRLSVVM